MIKNILLVGAGGFMGSVARYLAYILIEKRITGYFPLSTFTVNITGSFILGVIAALAFKSNLSESLRLLLAIGFCGSFTTFSTFAYENLQLINQKPFIALGYTIASLVVGIFLTYIGFQLGKQL